MAFLNMTGCWPGSHFQSSWLVAIDVFNLVCQTTSALSGGYFRISMEQPSPSSSICLLAKEIWEHQDRLIGVLCLFASDQANLRRTCYAFFDTAAEALEHSFSAEHKQAKMRVCTVPMCMAAVADMKYILPA
jgi:hypothetical protein